MNYLTGILFFVWFILNCIYFGYLYDKFIKYLDKEPCFKNGLTIGHIILIIICVPAILISLLLLILFFLSALIVLPFEKFFSIRIGKKENTKIE